jgi:hypothetical protein
MEKSRWLEFLSSRLKSQISIETAQKLETWGFALLGLSTLGGSLAAVSLLRSETLIGQTKVLFLLLFYVIMIFGVHLTGLLQKGEKPTARLLGIGDFTGLTVASIAVSFYSLVLLMLSHQVALSIEIIEASKFFAFAAWINDIVALAQFLGCLFFLASLFWFPKAVAGFLEKGPKIRQIFLWTHISLFVALGFGYLEMVALGSPDFFEEFRLSGLFWLFIGSSLLFLGRLSRSSSVPALASLELDVASGRLERTDDILARFKESFISKRLAAWFARLTRTIASETARIAGYSHDAIDGVSREVPSEIDLNQVEDRYRRAEVLHRKLERENQRFLLGIWFFDLNESARSKTEDLREQFSRELRNTKIELASVRKRIDEKLVSLKNRDWPVLEKPAAKPASEPEPVSIKI